MIHKRFSDAWPHLRSQLVAAGHCSHAIPSLKGLGTVMPYVYVVSLLDESCLKLSFASCPIY